MSSSATTRGRRAPRPSGDDRERAIVATLERLLEERSFGSITIDDLAQGAGLSRPTFYFYFASKQAVLAGLLERLLDEVDAGLAALPPRPEPRTTWWRAAIGVFVDVFGAHRAASLAISEAQARHEDIRGLWSTRYARWVHDTAAVIAAEQRRGAAPTGADPLALSTALNAMNERVIVGALAGGPGALAEDAVLDTLVFVWLQALYGAHPHPDPEVPR